MGKFLFFNNIHDILNESETQQVQPLKASIKAFWPNKGKKINPNYTKGSNEPKFLPMRVLNVQFFNVPAEIVDELDALTGFKPDKEYPSEDRSTFNIVYNCSDLFSEKDQKGIQVGKIFSFLQNKGYKIPDPEKLMKNIPTVEEVQQITKESNEKWMQLVSELGSGETNEMIEKFIQIFGKVYQYVYGHKFSFLNAQLILSQKPDATLVLTADDWEKYYNCKVNPNAQPILFWAPNSNRRWIENDKNKIHQAAKNIGVPYKDNFEFSGDATRGLAILASDTTGKLIPVYGFDNSDVTPIDESNDWRETKYQMKNNLTGEPNEKQEEFLNSFQPDDTNKKEYLKIKSLISDNAKLCYKIFVDNLKEQDEEMGDRFEFWGLKQNNPDYTALLPKALQKLVDKMLEDEYKVKKPSDRASSVKRIVGEILLLCGVWNRSALSSLQGGKISREMVVQDSNIINKLMTLLDLGKKKYTDKLKNIIRNSTINNNKETPVNESVLNEHVYCTPEKLINDFNLEVVDNENEFEKELNNTKNLMERLNNI